MQSIIVVPDHNRWYTHSVGSSGRVLWPSQTPVPDNTPHSQDT